MPLAFMRRKAVRPNVNCVKSFIPFRWHFSHRFPIHRTRIVYDIGYVVYASGGSLPKCSLLSCDVPMSVCLDVCTRASDPGLIFDGVRCVPTAAPFLNPHPHQLFTWICVSTDLYCCQQHDEMRCWLGAQNTKMGIVMFRSSVSVTGSRYWDIFNYIKRLQWIYTLDKWMKPYLRNNQNELKLFNQPGNPSASSSLGSEWMWNSSCLHTKCVCACKGLCK